MTRLPKKRGITQVGEDKSLILRQYVGKSPKVSSDENSCAKFPDPCTISDVLLVLPALEDLVSYRRTRNFIEVEIGLNKSQVLAELNIILSNLELAGSA
jgi:hypothetical protein